MPIGSDTRASTPALSHSLLSPGGGAPSKRETAKKEGAPKGEAGIGTPDLGSGKGLAESILQFRQVQQPPSCTLYELIVTLLAPKTWRAFFALKPGLRSGCANASAPLTIRSSRPRIKQPCMHSRTVPKRLRSPPQQSRNLSGIHESMSSTLVPYSPLRSGSSPCRLSGSLQALNTSLVFSLCRHRGHGASDPLVWMY